MEFTLVFSGFSWRRYCFTCFCLAGQGGMYLCVFDFYFYGDLVCFGKLQHRIHVVWTSSSNGEGDHVCKTWPCGHLPFRSYLSLCTFLRRTGCERHAPWCLFCFGFSWKNLICWWLVLFRLDGTILLRSSLLWDEALLAGGICRTVFYYYGSTGWYLSWVR